MVTRCRQNGPTLFQASLHGHWYATCGTFTKTLILTLDIVKRGEDPLLNLAFLLALYLLAVLWDFVSKASECNRLTLTSHVTNANGTNEAD